MQASDRVEFETILEELFAALDKPLTNAKREAFWMGLQRMTLIEFARCRDLLLEELSNGEPRRTFAVSDVWAAKRRLRARTPQVIEQPRETWQGDKWDIAASRHLLAHIMREIRANPRKYGRPASYVAMRTMSREQFPNADASPEFIAAVQTLVGFKNAWAQDMREWLDPETGEIGRPPVDVQQAAWADCMQRAEAAIAKQRRTAA